MTLQKVQLYKMQVWHFWQPISVICVQLLIRNQGLTL